MKLLTRIGLIFLSIIIILVIIAGIASIIIVRRPFPKTDGTLTVEGLKDKVEIFRDDFGVPHIFAQNEHDLFFSQGYVHAQDRFWQMEFSRHTGLGRLAELTGDATVDFDKLIRTIGWNRIAAKTTASIEKDEPEIFEMLEAYSAGVNAYILENEGTLSVNYTILNLVNEPIEIKPWEPVDSIAWSVVLAYDLSGRDMFEEIDRAKLVREFGEADVASWMPFYPYDNRPVIAPSDELTIELPEETPSDGEETGVDWNRVNLNIIGRYPDPFTFGSGPFVGSNSWVVSGEHTESGLPLLANDPHLRSQMPSIWYETGLHAPGWDVVGFSLPSLPGIVIGHNNKIAWGVTNAGTNVQDLFIEKINPSNPNQYEFMGEWRDMEVVQEVIKVNGGDDIIINVRITHHGPIINEIPSVDEELDGQRDVLAVQWTADEIFRGLKSAYLFNQAQNYDEFREALRYWDIPAQNFIYADMEGNIAYQLPGLTPIRKNGEGLMPVPGWNGEYEWEGFVPYEELPAVLNPEKGYIVTANHAIVDEEYPYLITSYWDNGNRGQRIDELVREVIKKGDITVGDFALIQFDSKSLVAEAFVPLLKNLSSSDPQVQAAIERLRGWDFQERRNSVPAALFEIFYMHLAQNVLMDDIGEKLFISVAQPDSGTVFFLDLADKPGAIWWDNINTSEKETREDIILQSLSDTIDWFEQHLGDDMNKWSWGSIHTAIFVSNPLGASGIGPVEALVNRGPFPADGGRDLVNAMSWNWEEPAVVAANPSMRMIVDMSDLDASRSIHPTGQSGHPYNQHYDDMIELWLNGEYHPMLFSREAVEIAADDTLILEPAE